jgi:hypothetical protein
MRFHQSLAQSTAEVLPEVADEQLKQAVSVGLNVVVTRPYSQEDATMQNRTIPQRRSRFHPRLPGTH